MTRNKPRLYIACLFRAPKPNGNPDKYHWALASGREGDIASGMLLYHVRNTITANGVQWKFEDPPRDLSKGGAAELLTLTAVGKIIDLPRLEKICRSLSINSEAAWDVFNCQTWVEQVLAAIAADGQCVGTNAIPADWTRLRQRCIVFADPFRQLHIRGQDSPNPRPTQNLMES
jgi:hypothetical protein